MESFFSELIDHIRENAQGHIDDAVAEERINCIFYAARALNYCGVDEDKAIDALLRYFDICRSDALMFWREL